MAKMSDLAPVTEYQLVQLASVAVAVGRAENVPLTAALEWLVRQVEDHQLPPRLFRAPMSRGERIGEWSPKGDTSQWRLIKKKADARQVDADKMPTIAQSRYLHVDDLAQLAASADTSEACRAALLELVGRRKLAPRQAAIPSHCAEAEPVPPVPPVTTPPASGSAATGWTPRRRADLLKEFRALEGRRPTEAGKKGKRGALMELVRKTAVDKDTLGDQLDKAIAEKKTTDLWAQLNTAK